MTNLPDPQRLVADLVAAIGALPLGDADGPENPHHLLLACIPADQRPLLATLHVLFPALLLPALDLLDRRRVVRWQRSSSSSSSSSAGPAVYQITAVGSTPHIVHLHAWHCTCAYFALAVDGHDDNDAVSNTPFGTPFSTPPCKHLLACYLTEQWPGLRAAAVSSADGTPAALAGVVSGAD